MMTAETILFILKIWTCIGSLVALIFLTVGIDRIDEDARGAYAFRPLLLPACLILWPLILWRWYLLETGRDNWAKRYKPPREIHFWTAIVFAIAIPAILLTGLSQKQKWPTDFQPQQISTELGVKQ